MTAPCPFFLASCEKGAGVFLSERMRSIYIVTFLFFAAIAPCSATSQCSAPPTCTKRLGAATYSDNFLQGPDYDASIHPGLSCLGADSGPTTVEAQLYVYALNEVSTKTGRVTMSAYLRTWWVDQRLAYNETSAGGCYDNPVILSTDQAGTIWNPNLYIENLVDAEHMKDLTYVYPDGGVWRSQQLLLTTKCSFTFVKLPFDVQHCDITLASYSLGVDSLRLIPRGGIVAGSGVGEGLKARGISSVMWEMEDSEDFTIAGSVETKGSWDYLQLQYTMTRMPKFFITQYMVPDMMFLALLYVGFFINPNIAPARAAVAVIPALILRSLSDSVYSSIPLISKTNVWLCDYLLASMGLCCLCTIQFGIVQYALLLEKPSIDRAAALKSKKDIVKKCLAEGKRLGISVADLLDPEDQQEALRKDAESKKKQEAARKAEEEKKKAMNADQGPSEDTEPEPPVSDSKPPEGKAPGPWSWCAGSPHTDSTTTPTQCEVMEKQKPAEEPQSGGILGSIMSSMSGTKTQETEVAMSLSQADLTLVVYACDLFESYAGGEGFIGPRRMSKVLKRFNHFYQPKKCEKLMRLFLHDRGLLDDSDEDLKLHVDLFLDFLVSVNDYLLSVPPPGQRNPFTPDLPPSVRWDILFRWLFPIATFFKLLLFFIMLESYPAN